MKAENDINNHASKKDLLAEIHRLTQNDFWNGNDLLYFFCEKYPLSTIWEVKEQQENKDPKSLTPAEAHLADQMWLIGRAYAALSERYSYTLPKDEKQYKDHRPGKPGEGFLETEGYESFFQDIARMLFRPKCYTHSTTYFRGESKQLDNEVDNLACRATNITNLIDELNNKAEDNTVTLSNACLLPKDFAEDARGIPSYIEKLQVAVSDAREQLKSFHNRNDENGFYKKLESLLTASNKILFEEKYDEDAKYIRYLAACVLDFTKVLNAARVLRDATITVLTIRKLCDNGSEDISSKGDLKTWAAFSKGAKLLVEGNPSVSISFSSKFLHFHYPQLFFIYDSISAGKTLKHSSAKSDARNALKAFNSNLSEKEKERYEEYYQHATRELELSHTLIDELHRSSDPQDTDILEKLKSNKSQLAENFIPHYTSITRLVDRLVMNSSVAS